MTINKQIKILDNKIRSNQAQYDSDRHNANKISALSSGELDKYEYLTGEDLGYKPDAVKKTKFEHSPSGQLFNKGLDSNEKRRLVKKAKNIKSKADNQLGLIRDQGDRQLDLIKDQSNKQLNLIGKISSEKIKPIEFCNKKNKRGSGFSQKESRIKMIRNQDLLIIVQMELQIVLTDILI